MLVDTHVWLWMLTDSRRLGAAKALIENGRNEVLLSAASSWEIAIKYALGRLPLPAPPDRFVPERLRSTGVTPIAIEHGHVLAVATLPQHHRDPFDRLLICQARSMKIPLVTADSAFTAYAVDLITAG